MRVLFILLTVGLCACRSQKGIYDKQIAQTLTSSHWKICQMTDDFYGEKRVYGVGPIPKNSYARFAGPFTGSNFYETGVSFGKDSAFYEYNENFLPADSVVSTAHDRFGRKWSVKNGVLLLPVGLKSVTNVNKPILYGALEVVAFTDSILLLKHVIDKKGWTRTFVLDKPNW